MARYNCDNELNNYLRNCGTNNGIRLGVATLGIIALNQREENQTPPKHANKKHREIKDI